MVLGPSGQPSAFASSALYPHTYAIRDDELMTELNAFIASSVWYRTQQSARCSPNNTPEKHIYFLSEPFGMSFFIAQGGIGGSVPSKTEDFRKKAALCAHAALKTHDPDLRRELEKLARDWLRLAEHAEQASQMLLVSWRDDDE
jgi:hypothetical protein